MFSLEHDRRKAEAWRANVEEAGLSEWAELLEGDARELLPQIEDVFDVVFIDAEKDDYEGWFSLARGLVEPGGLFVADNVLSHADPLAQYSAAGVRPRPSQRHRPARPRARAERRFALTVFFGTFAVPRKGGGPAVNSDSTGSGGTSG